MIRLTPEQLCSARRLLGVSRPELAAMCGLSESQIGALERVMWNFSPSLSATVSNSSRADLTG
jgi:transcriptional regulator with XRE-family HTH domain